MAFKILPVFIPFIGCKSICLFCNQESIAGFSVNDILQNVESQLKYYLNFSEKWDEVALYGGTFTSLSIDVQKSVLNLVRKYMNSPLRISTRPDYISEDTLDIMNFYNVKTIELGVQSLSERVLVANNRDYTGDSVFLTINNLKKYSMTIGLQIMCGLFKECDNDYRSTVDRLLNTEFDYIRIYPALVLKGSALEKLYYNGRYKPLTLPEAIKYTAYAFIRFTSAGIKVIRMGLQNNQVLEVNIVAGPYHRSFGDLVKIFILSLYLSKNNFLSINRKNNNYINSYGGFIGKKYEKQIFYTQKEELFNWEDVCKRIEDEDNRWFFEEQGDKIAEDLTNKANY